MTYIPPHRKAFVRLGEALIIPDRSGEYADVTLAKIRMRRRGTDDYFAEYAGWDRNAEGAIVFLLDDLLWEQRYGRYEAELSYAGVSVGVLELNYRPTAPITPGALRTLAPKLSAIPTTKPQGVGNVFDSIQAMQFLLTAPLEKGARLVPLRSTDKTALCAVTLAAAAEFEITDGFQSELVKFTACTAGEVLVDRAQSGTAQRRFPAGSLLRFVWSTKNVAAASE